MNNIYHVFYLLHLPPSPPSLFKSRSFLFAESTSGMKDGTIISQHEQLCKDHFSSTVGYLCQYQVNYM